MARKPLKRKPVARVRRRRCRKCRYQWESSVAVSRKARCPRCYAVQELLKRKPKLCAACGYAWLSASLLVRARCPSCGKTAERAYPAGQDRTCPRCRYSWRERKPPHVRRPRCPSCFANLKTVGGKKSR